MFIINFRDGMRFETREEAEREAERVAQELELHVDVAELVSQFEHSKGAFRSREDVVREHEEKKAARLAAEKARAEAQRAKLAKATARQSEEPKAEK